MKVSGIRYYKDDKSFNMLKKFGIKINNIENVERIDERIEELINLDYKTIIITNELAGFSQDIARKYNKKEGINIIIIPNKNLNNE